MLDTVGNIRIDMHATLDPIHKFIQDGLFIREMVKDSPEVKPMAWAGPVMVVL